MNLNRTIASAGFAAAASVSLASGSEWTLTLPTAGQVSCEARSPLSGGVSVGAFRRKSAPMRLFVDGADWDDVEQAWATWLVDGAPRIHMRGRVDENVGWYTFEIPEQQLLEDLFGGTRLVVEIGYGKQIDIDLAGAFDAVNRVAECDISERPLGLNDGRYVTYSELCYLDEDRMTFLLGDQVGWVTRYIDGFEVRNGYEMSCSVVTPSLSRGRVDFAAECSSEGEMERVNASYVLLSRDAFLLGQRAFVRCGSEAAVASFDDQIEESTGEIVAIYHEANGRCRGSSDTLTIARSCAEREAIAKVLEARGWCYGQNADAEYQKFWAPCLAEILR